MKNKIMYIEHKSDQNDRGEAWIGLVEFSKSGRTIYFNDQAFKQLNVSTGNFYDLETHDEYWISGIKKNGQDRHWAGTGKIYLQRAIADDYMSLLGLDKLNTQHYELADPKPTDKSRFKEIENSDN
ncbi:hypothetical protein [Fulvivirga ligni]|uniref:hypothetical protein n=1 Tax=Fulvivirga ligni TaxID=2904246 RepID=UPI001F3F2A32|nr:hypothetical protein [Fulvivirga ligni]UII20738.1 hypothetical protein LVD16_23125 [Fulvivirga ligni]